MTGDPTNDIVAIGSLAGLGLLLLGLLWPAAPNAGEAAAAATGAAPTAATDIATEPAPDTLSIQPATVIFEADGLRLEQRAWSFGEATGQAWLASVPLPGRARVHPSETVVPFDQLLPDDDGPWAAINGGFYERGAMGLVLADGVEHTARARRGGSGIFTWSPGPGGGPAVVHRDAWKPGPTQALQSIDRVVDAGRSLVNRKEAARSAARSAVAISADRLWLVALADDASVHVVEGGVQLRDTVVLGLPLWTFADFLVEATGAQTALNLDGAVSTQLAAAAPGHHFLLRGERGTINSLVIRP